MSYAMILCCKCLVEKTSDQFRSDKKAADGFDHRCRDCERERHRKWRSANPEKVKAAQAKHNKTEKRAVSISRYKAESADVVAASAARYREKYPDRVRAATSRSTKKNPIANRMRRHVRRACMEMNGVFKILPRELTRLYSQPCFNCGSAENQTADHAIPVARGGRHSIGNLITLCRTCNTKKHNRLLVEWRAGRSTSHREQRIGQ